MGLSLECGDLSPLWSAVTSRGLGSVESTESLRRQAAFGQSGDRSPHSKERLGVNSRYLPVIAL
jgi:hypothetical protein